MTEQGAIDCSDFQRAAARAASLPDSSAILASKAIDGRIVAEYIVAPTVAAAIECTHSLASGRVTVSLLKSINYCCPRRMGDHLLDKSCNRAKRVRLFVNGGNLLYLNHCQILLHH